MIKDERQEEFGNITTPNISVNALKKSIQNVGVNLIRDKDQQYSPRQIKFRTTDPLWTLYTARYQIIFLSRCFLCKNFGNQVRECKAYNDYDKGSHQTYKNNLVNKKSRDIDGFNNRNHNSFPPLHKCITKCYRCTTFVHMAWDYVTK